MLTDPYHAPPTIVSRYYTARGQLQSVGWGAGATSYVYWPDGKINCQAHTNGVTTTFGYDGRGMINSVAHKNGAGQNLASRTYWRDNRDRITAWKRGTDYSLNGMETGLGDRYGYDEEGQLKTASYRALTPETTASNPMRSDIFSYDALGNRKGSNYVASRGSMNFTRRDNGLNQYLAWWPFSGIFYDDNFGGSWTWPGNGVTMADGWITASFNALNQPVAIWCPGYPGGASAQYLWFGYDPLGRCVKRWMGDATGNPAGSTPPTYLYYDGSNLVQEGITANNVARQYVHGGRVDEIVASQTGGVWNFHHYDARGHCILLAGASAIIVEQYDYDAFGMPYFYDRLGYNIHSSGFGNRFLFTGREWMGDLKLYDFRNRIYQPELGRFLQPDPQEFAAGDYNLYRYCHNDPVNKSDPTGLAERILKDFQWDFACRGDSGNSFQGDYNAYVNRGHDHTPMGTNKVADGNYNDSNIDHHLRKQHVGGDTEFTMGNVESGVARPTLNWWVQKEHMDDKTILGELEHVSRHLWSAESGDVAKAISKFNANPNGPYAKEKLEDARQVEKIWHLQNLHGNPNRHDLNKNPKLWEKMTPTQIQNAIRNVTPMEDPRPQYLPY